MNDETVAGPLEREFLGRDHVRSHVRQYDSLRPQLSSVGQHLGVTQMNAGLRGQGLRLADEQIRSMSTSASDAVHAVSPV